MANVVEIAKPVIETKEIVIEIIKPVFELIEEIVEIKELDIVPVFEIDSVPVFEINIVEPIIVIENPIAKIFTDEFVNQNINEK